MTDQQIDQITTLRIQGFGYATIAKAVSLQKGTVVALLKMLAQKGLWGGLDTVSQRVGTVAQDAPSFHKTGLIWTHQAENVHYFFTS